MKRLLCTIVLLACAGTPLVAERKPAIFVAETGDGFNIYITAALEKKNVPATVVTSADYAELTLKAAPVLVQKESARMKVVKCIVQSCANTDDKASTSVQLLDRHGVVVWSYSIDNDDGSRKSMAETIAKRLKRDYFKQ